MSTFNSILKQVLEENKTDNLKAERAAISKLIKQIKGLLKDNKINATPMLGGSAAKETFIGNDFDVDIFVMFNYNEYKDKDISKILTKAIKPLKPVKVHGSRDYFHINKRYEIVPVLKIAKPEQAINVTDASPLHAAWVKKHMTKKPRLKDEIKLAKIFFKGIGVYGAESYIKGLSGHVTDILIIKYGSFNNLLKNIAKWRDHVEIDIANHKTVLDKAKIQGPMIVVDPIQPNRNASAAINQTTFERLKKKTREFLKRPSVEFFQAKEFDISKTRKLYNIIIKADVPSGKIDIVGAKLLKAHEYIEKELKLFRVKKSGWYWDKKKTSYFYYKTELTKLPNYFIQEGPGKEYPEHMDIFKRKYKSTRLVKGKLVAKVRRDKTILDDILKDISKSDYIKMKIGGFKIVQ
ncbi:hypothetical protein H6503_02980 [Candidatus Woesearchaeota archaeon]|nr:hypothetical protein [Candidatus Woesearchaeota archaeon]